MLPFILFFFPLKDKVASQIDHNIPGDIYIYILKRPECDFSVSGLAVREKRCYF